MPVPQSLAEVNQALAALAPEYEGWQDFARLNLKPETAAKVQEIIGTYSHRIAALNNFRVASEALLGDGYPEFDIFQVSAEIYADLQNNDNTINAAFAKVETIAQATNLGLNVKEVRPKT